MKRLSNLTRLAVFTCLILTATVCTGCDEYLYGAGTFASGGSTDQLGYYYDVVFESMLNDAFAGYTFY